MALVETRALPAQPGTVAVARHFVVDVLRAAAWDDDSVGKVALLTTELATNVVLHVGCAYDVTVHLTDHEVRVEVIDESSLRPVMKRVDPHEEGGRGLFFVDIIANAWGVEEHHGGKSVWFEVRRGLLSP